MEGWLKIAILISIGKLSLEADCKTPRPAVAFDNSRYYGTWYELGNVGNLNWAKCGSGTVCRKVEIKSTHGSTSGDATLTHFCRNGSPKGQRVNESATLQSENPPGHWMEKFGSSILSPKLDYTVFYLDEEYTMEYECHKSVFIFSESVHILGRSPTADAMRVNLLLKYAAELNLIHSGSKYTANNQTGCW